MTNNERDTENETNKNEINTNAAQVMGVIFIVLGVISLLVIVYSFDFETYNYIKDLSYSYKEEISIMQQELFDTWLIGIGSLIINVAIGVLLLTLGKIQSLLQKIVNKDKTLT